jgi:hypothetical protein
MRPILAAALWMWLILPAVADDKPTPPAPDFSTVAPEHDSRLAKVKDGQPQKIGLLSYYPNNGGGYTFLDGKHIAFYALPYRPTTYHTDYVGVVLLQCLGTRKGIRKRVATRLTLSTVGTVKMPPGAQTIYRSLVKDLGTGAWHREDTPIAEWSREAPDAPLRLSLFDDRYETRLKLKSIVPVLEYASKRPMKSQ